MFKIIALVACLTVVASAQYYGGEHGAPKAAAHHDEDYNAHPKYKFEYGVKDAHTGDHKTQWESRTETSWMDEADGTHRIVDYKADDHNGFEAVVKTVHGHH
ncbi:cuticle protein 8-like [Culex quinquefasciatus]|uniref:cuticle protein 8-like n=1 Tax=Culex quinquefasciatus TaxID=7176 RepID=UPI0018E38193|nr:cuticle protein 8-like [Culex quinquefasciatus]